MKALVMFDASASDYEVKSELYGLRTIPGVKEVILLRRVKGEAPAYCLEIEVEESGLAGLAQEMEATKSRYSGYVSGVKLLVYAPT